MIDRMSNIPTTVLSGRSVLKTDLTSLTAETLKADLVRVLPQHTHNRQQIRSLQEYHRGWHPAVQNREKTTRTDVDNKITVNYAQSITRDIVGYFLGKPIQYTNRKGTYRKQMENFRNALHAENKMLVDYQIAEVASICGVGYRGIFTEKKPRNGTSLRLLSLEPQNTFVVYYSDPTKGAAYAVTFYDTSSDNEASRFYKVYTPEQMYLFEDTTVNGNDPFGSGALELRGTTRISFGGGLPIIEYPNNQWRLGDWETAMSLMDAIDFVTSDGVNDIQQAVNSVLVAMGMEMDEDIFAQLSSNGFLNVANIPPGVNPVVEFISQAMDANVGKEMRDYLEATLRVIVGVPDRKTRSGGGGDTGDAVFMRDGWQDIDLVATSKEPYFIQAEREALAVMLYILETKKELKGITPGDIEIHFNRNKTANLQSKAQVYQTLTSGEAPLAPEDALDIADLTTNESDVIMRMNAYQAERDAKMRENQASVSNNEDPDSQ